MAARITTTRESLLSGVQSCGGDSSSRDGADGISAVRDASATLESRTCIAYTGTRLMQVGYRGSAGRLARTAGHTPPVEHEGASNLRVEQKEQCMLDLSYRSVCKTVFLGFAHLFSFDNPTLLWLEKAGICIDPGCAGLQGNGRLPGETFHALADDIGSTGIAVKRDCAI